MVTAGCVLIFREGITIKKVLALLCGAAGTVLFLEHFSAATDVYKRQGEDDEKAKAIARFIKEQIGFCALVGEEPLEERDLSISPASRWFFGLEYVTVFQVLAYRMADDRGRDLHRGVNAVVSQYITKTL